MSTISITTPSFSQSPAFARQQSSTKLRLTVRGRRVLLALASVPLAAGVVLAALSGGAALAAAGGEAAAPQTITVEPGDTFWGIAAEIAPGENTRDVIRELQQVNGLRSSALPVGFELVIPAEYANAE